MFTMLGILWWWRRWRGEKKEPIRQIYHHTLPGLVPGMSPQKLMAA